MGAFKKKKVLFLVFLTTICGCSSHISPYSQSAYEQAVSLKVDAVQLIEKSTEPYVKHEFEARNLMVRVEKAYEYAKGRPNNEISTKQWEILKSPENGLLGEVIAYWERKQILTPEYGLVAKKNVSDAFDTIIRLESQKIKTADIK